LVFVAACLGAADAKADELAPGVRDIFELSTFATGLELPTAIEFLPDGRMVIAEKTGRVLVRLPNGNLVVAGKLDVDAKTEKGLLNVIRHPSFTTTHELIFYYSAAKAPELDKHKVAVIRLGDDNRLDLSTERVLLQGLRGPDDHEMGGGLAIDRTGRLLVGVGDTGCRARKLPEPPYTPTNYFATCLTNGNGKILRVGLDGSIPTDNPLIGVDAATACGEKCSDDPFVLKPAVPRRDIWTWGLRNPWRLWVDPKTGSVWTADVGDMANEEIDIIPKEGGLHYGWPWREGGAGHPVSECRKVLPDRGDCVDPVYYCRHDDVPGDVDAGCKSINGGLIVDDCRWPEPYRGRYYFADNANGRIWSLQPTPARDGIVKGSRQDVGQATGFVVDMDVGADGAMYLAVMRIPPDESKVLRIAPKIPAVCTTHEEMRQTATSATPSRDKRLPAVSLGHTRRARHRALFGSIAALALIAALAIALTESRT
jgi:glucose/arabinose dehydrogenase